MDSHQREQLLAQIGQWHEADQFSAIIQAVEALPERDYELTCLLARAYSNLAVLGDGQANADNEYVDVPTLEKSVALLESVAAPGENDPFWNARLAYALWMLPGREADALSYARHWAALEPDTPDAKALIKEIESFLNCPAEPDLYTQEQMELVEAYINDTFGTFDQVFHELVSPDIHVDICLIPPAEGRDYYTLVTMGMGAHRMNVPAELAEYKLERAEVLICLPPDWQLGQEALSDEGWYWPLHLLKSTARMPIADDTWIAMGHTMGLHPGETYGGTQFNSALLVPPGMVDGDAVCPLPDGDEVNFYQLIPLYPEELEYKFKHGLDEVLDCMSPFSFVVDTHRPNRLQKAPTNRRSSNKRGSYYDE